MKIYILLTSAFFLLGSAGKAQNSIEEVLKLIEQNNKTLQASGRLNEAQKLEAQTGNYLANPTVEFDYLWGNRNTGGEQNEVVVKQAFDFPTVYSHKNRIADLKTGLYDNQTAAGRQQILLTAKQTCQEIIYLRKQKVLLAERLQNALRLSELYGKKLEKGDATILEINKIQLEQVNVQNDNRLNEAALKAKVELLRNLNGGEPIAFDEQDYPVQLHIDFNRIADEYMSADPSLKSLEDEQAIATQEIKLSKSESLPKFDVGYRRDAGTDDAFNGFTVGVSIPLFENKNRVKKAKAQAEYTSAVVEDNKLNVRSGLQQLYEQVQALQTAKEDYARILSTQQNIQLLNKALDAGQISMINYFTEVAALYDARKNYLDIEKNYHDLLAQLLKYEL